MEIAYAAITIVLVIVWYLLEKTIMTPWDIHKKWKADISYIAPEDFGLLMAKTSRAITMCEEIFDSHGPNSDAGSEAVEVLQQLRKFYRELIIRSKS